MTRGARPARRLRLAGLLLAVTACGGGSDPSAPAATGTTVPLRGADISALGRIEQAGGVFRDGGAAGDAITILRGQGSNLFRLRLFVDPSGADVEVNDLAYTTTLAARIRASGAALLLDLHYSDTWADPGHQVTPAAWAALDSAGLEAAVEQYSADVISHLRQAGALPAIVQVGNEVDDGMLWPIGRLSGPAADSSARWNRFSRLLKAGIRGVRSALLAGDSVRIMIHYSGGGNYGGTKWFFDHLEASGVPYDVIGLSYYPWWHGSLTSLRANLLATAARYGREVLVAETSYPWRAGGWEGMAPDRTHMTWPVSPAGQARFLADVLEAVEAVPGGRGAGVVWWYPEAILVPGVFIWGGGSLALFGADGGVLPAAAAFRPAD